MARKGKSSEVGAAHIRLDVEGAEQVQSKLRDVRETTEREMDGVSRSTTEATGQVTGAFDGVAASADRGFAKLTKFAGIITGVVGAVGAFTIVLKPLIQALDKTTKIAEQTGKTFESIDFSSPAGSIAQLQGRIDELQKTIGRVETSRDLRSLFQRVVGDASVAREELDRLTEALQRQIAIQERQTIRGVQDEIDQINIGIADDPEVRRQLEVDKATAEIRRRQRETTTAAEKQALEILLAARINAIDTEHDKKMQAIANERQAELDAINAAKTARLQAAIEEGRQLEENARRYREGLTRAIDSAFNSLDSRVQASFGLETLVVEMQAIGEQLDAIRNNTGGI